MSNAREDKAALRIAIRKVLAELPKSDFINAGIQIARHVERWLQSHSGLLKHKRIVLFKSLSDEVDASPLSFSLSALGFSLYFLSSDANLSHSDESIQQKLSGSDLIFVPGRAFDKEGHRLGRGKGFYDRFFAQLQEKGYPTPLLMGLALDSQIVEKVPTQAHDVRMHYICTPSLGIVHIEK